MKEDNLYKTIGKRILEARKKKGYTREKLAEYARISAMFLYEIETGKKGFTIAVLFRISNALGVKSDYFLKDEIEGQAKHITEI